MKLTDKIYYYPEKGMLDCNTYLIRGGLNIIIDPGLNRFLPALIEDMRADGIDPKDIDIITNTHLHLDHWWANDACREVSGARFICHPRHKQYYDVTVVEASRAFGLKGLDLNEDGIMEDGRLDGGGLDIEVIAAPGHSPDSICFYCRQERFLVCGDVIFDRNTGRVDLPGGSADELKASIEALSGLEIDYLLPGHMEIVSGRQAVKDNFSFVKEHVFPWL
ncbi:MAG: MBL fold metallo-hydrolase [Chloroflexota bacterium]